MSNSDIFTSSTQAFGRSILQGGQTLPSSTTSAGTTTSRSVTGAAASNSGNVATGQDDPIKKFEDYMQETPAQRMQDSWLAQHGISKEQYAAMSAADKQKLVDEMRHDIETKLQKAAAGGSSAGVSASVASLTSNIASSSTVPSSSARVQGLFVANAI